MKEHFGGDANGVMSLNEELAKYSKKYPYEVLVKKIVPEGVDVVNKEVKFLNGMWNWGFVTLFDLMIQNLVGLCELSNDR